MNILHPENRRLKIEDFIFADFYDLILRLTARWRIFVENKDAQKLKSREIRENQRMTIFCRALVSHFLKAARLDLK